MRVARRLSGLFALGSLLFPVLQSLQGPTALAPADARGPEGDSTLHRWLGNLTGHVALGVRYGVAQPTFCVFTVGAALHDTPESSIRFLVYAIEDGRERLLGYYQRNDPPQVHAGPVDTRPVVFGAVDAIVEKVWGPPGAGGSFGMGFGLSVTEEIEFRVVAFDLDPAFGEFHTYDRSAMLEMECEGPVSALRFFGSREAIAFTREASMAGGVGASVSPVAWVNLLDRVDRDFDSPQVHVRIFHLGVIGPTAVRLRVEHPQGAEEWSIEPEHPPGPRSFALDGPAGRYGVELTGVGAGVHALIGLMAGYRPLDSLDELVEPWDEARGP